MYFGLSCKTCKPCYQLWSHHTKFAARHNEDMKTHIEKCVKSTASRQRLRFFLEATGSDPNRRGSQYQHYMLITGNLLIDRILSRLVEDCFAKHKTVEVVVEDLIPATPQQLFISLKGQTSEMQQLTRRVQETCEAAPNCTYEALTREESFQRRAAAEQAHPSRQIATLPGANPHTHMVWTRVLPHMPNFLKSTDLEAVLEDKRHVSIRLGGHLFNSGFITVCSHMISEFPGLKFSLENIDLMLVGNKTKLDFCIGGNSDDVAVVCDRIRATAAALPSYIHDFEVHSHTHAHTHPDAQRALAVPHK
eukprot:UC1_evm1s2105